MNRQRLTWNRKGSAHPATPDEGPASPAYPGKDPEANAYENGDTSSWAEDPTKGPYNQSAHPATPDEGPASPAYNKAAALEKKAAKCIRIATSMLGADATAAAIEDQALSLMDLPDRSIAATLQRLGEEEEEVEEEETEESKKKASDRFASMETRIARLERILIRLAGDEEEEEKEEEAKKKAGEEEEEEEVEEEAKKKAGEEEEEEEAKKKANSGMYMSEEEKALEAMLKEEGMFGDTAGAEPEEEAHCGEMVPAEDDMNIDMMMGDMDDPMGVMDADLDADEQMILAKLYGKVGEEKEEETEEEEAKKKAADEEEEEEKPKTAAARTAAARSGAQRPQAKKASTGPKTLGSVTKVASSQEIDDLSKIWESSPNVDKHFR